MMAIPASTSRIFVTWLGAYAKKRKAAAEAAEKSTRIVATRNVVGYVRVYIDTRSRLNAIVSDGIVFSGSCRPATSAPTDSQSKCWSNVVITECVE
jgi:hypothetical protein